MLTDVFVEVHVALIKPWLCLLEYLKFDWSAIFDVVAPQASLFQILSIKSNDSPAKTIIVEGLPL